MTKATPLPLRRAADYSPIGFLREHRAALADHVNQGLLHDPTTMTAGTEARWHWRKLEWDSAYFGTPMFRLESASWETGLRTPAASLARTLRGLRSQLRETEPSHYIFGEIPAEDTHSLQALGLDGFRLVETRLTYFTCNAATLSWPERYPIRLATAEDAPNLRDVAARSRNPYDRYHAEPFFSDAVADRYLGAYATEAVNGMANMVVVPNTGVGDPPGAFFAASVTSPPACPVGVDHDCPLEIGVGRIFLVAVGPERRGWHRRLLVETTRLMAEYAVAVVYMKTQAANRAVIRNCEKVGYQLGRVTHIMAATDKDTT